MRRFLIALLPIALLACLADKPAEENIEDTVQGLHPIRVAVGDVMLECRQECPDVSRVCNALCSGAEVDIPEHCPTPACYCPDPDDPTRADLTAHCPDPSRICDAVCSGIEPPAVPTGCATPACYCGPTLANAAAVNRVSTAAGDPSVVGTNTDPNGETVDPTDPVICPDPARICHAACNGCEVPPVPAGCPIPGCACDTCIDPAQQCEMICNGGHVPPQSPDCPIVSCNCDDPNDPSVVDAWTRNNSDTPAGGTANTP